MTPRITAILREIRIELERRAGVLEGGGLASLNLMCYFEGDTYAPRTVVTRPEFTNKTTKRR